MARLEDAVSRIKTIECPTGEVEHWVEGILNDYGITHSNAVKRERNLDRNGAQAYITNIQDSGGRSIVILAKSGMDDYVARVVDAYID